MRSLHRRSTIVFGIVSIVLGVAIMAETARAHGGSFGYLLGVLFVALGAGRLYLLQRR